MEEQMSKIEEPMAELAVNLAIRQWQALAYDLTARTVRKVEVV